MRHVLESGSVATSWCMTQLKVVRDTAHRDLVGLVGLGVLSRRGHGRGVTYVLKGDEAGTGIIR